MSAILWVALIASAVATSAGLRVVPSARAATDTIVATATVGSGLSVGDACAGAYDISVVLNAYAADDCAIDFGSTNDPTTTLRIASSAGAFMSGGFTDHSGGCGALVDDTVGIKYTGGDAGVSSSLGCAISASGTNADYIAIPDAATNACAATTLGTDNTCTLAVGLKETGGDVAAGNYTGTLNLDVVA